MERNIRLLRIKDVVIKTTLGKSSIWQKVAQNQFPKPAKLSPTISVWKESDIDLWIESHFQKVSQV